MKKFYVVAICLLLLTSLFSINSLAENKRTDTTLSNNSSNSVNLQNRNKTQQAINTATERVNGVVSLLKEINSGMYPIPKYMFKKAKVIAVMSSHPRCGERSGDEAGGGIVIARNPKTKLWEAPIFITIKDGYIRDILEQRGINAQFSNKDTTILFFGMNDSARNLFCKEELGVGNLAGLLVSSGIFQYRKQTEDAAAISVGLFGYIYSKQLIIGASIENSVVKQDKVLNEAVYERKILDEYLPTANFIPKPILACTDMMNQLYPGGQ
jgi:lipid-binding SYLF domain-containing protein